ncbi:MAG: family hydrolase [Novosphingobium lindaniclasticum]|jgi:diadenosine tetraphosphate (Ap4A) HIT family hydrolase|uniref:Histidine triad (HIT) protein n=1 Tax=Novosphingobium lindaniclasticum LE124 TaxID=1096930 RepID=T0GW15_9SPHN|nr:HIT family protein [Novosphingobium lindaniclasticum]EQB08176.1 histidine triad (HIT) protein [Novosphingobium lindaniclasticum LE124]MDF2639970.1 family hydrolase [Novosphingobium lindaniclasticum]
MNATMEKFGYPHTLVAEFAHWAVLARPTQPTLGSLVLAAKSDATAFGALPAESHADLKLATAAIEAALRKAVGYDRLNYLMLMMVDPHVHFHVIPRYEGAREWQGQEFVDCGWPKVPDLGHAVALDGDDLAALVEWLKEHFG